MSHHNDGKTGQGNAPDATIQQLIENIAVNCEDGRQMCFKMEEQETLLEILGAIGTEIRDIEKLHDADIVALRAEIRRWQDTSMTLSLQLQKMATEAR